MRKPHPAKPICSLGDTIRYNDRQGRFQEGIVKRIEAAWTSDGRPPLVIYFVSHPTARNGRISITADHIYTESEGQQ